MTSNSLLNHDLKLTLMQLFPTYNYSSFDVTTSLIVILGSTNPRYVLCLFTPWTAMCRGLRTTMHHFRQPRFQNLLESRTQGDLLSTDLKPSEIPHQAETFVSLRTYFVFRVSYKDLDSYTFLDTPPAVTSASEIISWMFQ